MISIRYENYCFKCGNSLKQEYTDGYIVKDQW
jgi:hypothetical protein